MKLFVKIVTCGLLLFNGIGAVYGGLNMIMYPDGSKIHLSPHLLQHSLFNSYLIPGIVLLIVNGFLSLYTFAAVLLGFNKYRRWVILQGGVLLVWLIIQIAMIHVIHYFHFVMFCVGILLIIFGNMHAEDKSKGNEKF